MKKTPELVIEQNSDLPAKNVVEVPAEESVEKEELEDAPSAFLSSAEPEFDEIPSESDFAPIPFEEQLPEVVETVDKSTKDIVVYDPLEAYLREISRIPQLSREEEKLVALEYYQNKSKEAAYQLISSNLWLVVKVAREYERAARNLLDLIQEGNIGLIEAVKNFDPYREVRFPSYAVWWIRAYVIRFVMANWRMVKLGTTQAQRKLFFNLRKEKEKLEREGFIPGPKLLAEKLQVRESDIVEMEQRLLGGDVSVDAPLPGEGDGNLLGILPSGELSAEELLSERESHALMVSTVQEFRETLNDKEKAILDERLLNEDRTTLGELADRFHLSKERVRQIENRIKDKLKEFAIKRLGKESQEFLN